MSKGCAFLMDMGTGKTITTIAVAGALNGKHKVKNLLVVSPKSIVTVMAGYIFSRGADAAMLKQQQLMFLTMRISIGRALQKNIQMHRCTVTQQKSIYGIK